MQYLRISTSDGYDNSWLPTTKSSPSSFRQTDWLLHSFDFSRALPKKMIMCKPPAIATYQVATGMTAGKARGLYYSTFNPASNSEHYIFQAVRTGTGTGKISWMTYGGTTWQDLGPATFVTNKYSYDGSRVHCETVVDPNGIFKVYYSFGGYMYKWRNSSATGNVDDWNSTIIRCRDKGSASAIATAVLTWNPTIDGTPDPTKVTSDTNLSTVLEPGDWIRRSSSSIYWDEVDSISSDGFTITLTFASEDSGTSGAGTAQKASTSTIKSRALLFWKGKLWTIDGNITLSASVTDDCEDFSSTNSSRYILDAGLVDTGGKQLLTGLAALGEYLFIFRENSYLVYRWTGVLGEPIELVRSWNYGCVSHNTIQCLGDAIIYSTGTQVRVTTGGSDVSISDPIDKTLSGLNYTNDLFYGDTTAADLMPQSSYGQIDEIYILSFPGTTTGVEYWYSVKLKKWIGTTKHNMGSMEISEHIASNIKPWNIIFQYGQSSAQLYQVTKTGALDSTNSVSAYSNMTNFGVQDKKKKVYWIEITFVPLQDCNTKIGLDWWDYNSTHDMPGVTFASNTRAQQYNLHNIPTDTEYHTTSDYYSVKRRFLIDGAEVYEFAFVLFEDNSTPLSPATAAGWGISDITIAYEPVETA